MEPPRRRVLAALGTGSLLGLAGCLQTGADSPSGPQQLAKLVPDDGDDEDIFGSSVAVSNDGRTALVGAPRDNDPNGYNKGSAYVFAESDGDWHQQTKLAPHDGEESDWFGRSVAMSGDGSTTVIGAGPDEFQSGHQAGLAYVFAQSGGRWQEQARLVPGDGDSGDRFGESVALSADGRTAIVGARADEDPNGRLSGSAYVFAQSGGRWQQKAKLVPDDGAAVDLFGESVALSADGSTALIGAGQDDIQHTEDAGSAYVFVASSGGWSQQTKLTAEDGDYNDGLGHSVTLSADGRTAVVGAPGDEEPNQNVGLGGSAYVFAASGGNWHQQTKLATDGDGPVRFAWSVAVSDDGSTALIGAAHDADPNGNSAGSASMFTGSGGGWHQQTKLSATDGDRDDWFGRSVALTGDGSTAVIGAPHDEDPNGGQAGSAYVFR